MFERTTGDDPFRRNADQIATLLDDPQDRGDAEAQIERIVFAPATRSYRASALVYPAVGASDSTLDRLAGYRGPERFELLQPLPGPARISRLERLRSRLGRGVDRRLDTARRARAVDLVEHPETAERLAPADHAVVDGRPAPEFVR